MRGFPLAVFEEWNAARLVQGGGRMPCTAGCGIGEATNERGMVPLRLGSFCYGHFKILLENVGKEPFFPYRLLLFK